MSQTSISFGFELDSGFFIKTIRPTCRINIPLARQNKMNFNPCDIHKDK
ncbi:MAG: hypothetical protein PHZ02_06115 [Desulfocapsaceae bacterium]|nr:hypothetical protein [Desulfocapsaceae bacterium]